MHPTAMDNGRLFFDCYLGVKANKTVVDIGAQNVNGTLKELVPASNRYVGIDFVAGKE